MTNVLLITILSFLGVFGTWGFMEFDLGRKSKDLFNKTFEEYILPKETYKKLPPREKSRIVSISLFILAVDLAILTLVKGLTSIYLINAYELVYK